MATAPEGSTSPTVEEQELTEEEIAQKRQDDLNEAMTARQDAEEQAEEERKRLAEQATSHIGQPEETPANALDPNRTDDVEAAPGVPPAPPKNEGRTQSADTGGSTRSQQAKDEAEAKQTQKRLEQAKKPSTK